MMKKAIILIIILMVSTTYADGQIGKFLSRGFYYGLTHQPTLPPTDYDYEIEAARQIPSAWVSALPTTRP